MAGEETQKTAEAVQPDVKQEGETPADFDAWLATQDDGTKALLLHARPAKTNRPASSDRGGAGRGGALFACRIRVVSAPTASPYPTSPTCPKYRPFAPC
jgi:hypothetical protein